MSGQPRLGLIGYGAMGRFLVASLATGEAPIATSVILLRRAVGNPPAGAQLVTTLPELIASRPTLVAECAGHGAVNEAAAALLEAGIDVVIASIGALAEPALRDRLRRASESGGGRLILPAGAIGGLDALRAARSQGLDRVTYVGTKPPGAWLGTPAEQACDLDSLTEPMTIFTGTAAEAARSYPKNANVTAAVALAGIGFDATEVRLVADPRSTLNSHEIKAEGAFGSLSLSLQNRPLPDNPKTSMLAALSLEQAVRKVMLRSAF